MPASGKRASPQSQGSTFAPGVEEIDDSLGIGPQPARLFPEAGLGVDPEPGIGKDLLEAFQVVLEFGRVPSQGHSAKTGVGKSGTSGLPGLPPEGASA